MNIRSANLIATFGIAAGCSFLIGTALSFGIRFETLVGPILLCGLVSSTPLLIGITNRDAGKDSSIELIAFLTP